LADSVRYTWGLISREIPGGAVCNPPGPGNGVLYWVLQRNFDISPTPLNQIQYSPYVNGELYSYFIDEDCGAQGASPPLADALEIPVDPLNFNPPVASGHGEFSLQVGSFYTGLTRDDVAGLRYLMSSNNIFAPSLGYQETSASGSVATSGGGGGITISEQITTFSLTILSLNDPNTLQTLVPGILITSVATNVVNGFTNFAYTFGNVVTNSFSTNTTVQILTTNIAPLVGTPVGSPPATNVSFSKPFQTNLVSGDFFVVPTNSCGITVLSTLSTNVVTITNLFIFNTNTPGQLFSQSLIVRATNHVLSVSLCTNSPGVTNSSIVVGDLQGIGKVQFVRVSDGNYDYLTSQFFSPITNQYTMVVNRNGQALPVTFQRIVTRPDFLFMGASLATGGDNTPLGLSTFSRTTPNFVNSRAAANLSGPGIIDPTAANIVVTFNTVGPIYLNSSPAFLSGPGGAARTFIWGSFDGTTNAPIVYPNGTSIVNLAAEALFQISPTTLPNATHAVFYSVTLSATGGQSPYIWSLAPGSASLPTGLNLSSGGVISGTPTQTGTFNLVIQLRDSSNPALTVQINYPLTIN
jgi:hypothetical protein